MNLQQILMAIVQSNTQRTQSPIENINKMSNKLKRQITEYEKIEKVKKQGEEKHLLQAFFKVLDYIGTELQEVKQKYQNLDKQKMKEDKCVQLAKDIKIFREECFYLRGRLREAKAQLKNIQIENSLLEQQQGLLQKVYEKKSKQKDDIKYKTLSQFWYKQKNKQINLTFDKFDRQSPLNNQRKTDFDLRPDMAKKTSTPYSSQNRLNRLKSTSQQPRKYGKSVELGNGGKMIRRSMKKEEKKSVWMGEKKQNQNVYQ